MDEQYIYNAIPQQNQNYVEYHHGTNPLDHFGLQGISYILEDNSKIYSTNSNNVINYPTKNLFFGQNLVYSKKPTH